MLSHCDTYCYQITIIFSVCKVLTYLNYMYSNAACHKIVKQISKYQGYSIFNSKWLVPSVFDVILIIPTIDRKCSLDVMLPACITLSTSIFLVQNDSLFRKKQKHFKNKYQSFWNSVYTYSFHVAQNMEKTNKDHSQIVKNDLSQTKLFQRSKIPWDTPLILQSSYCSTSFIYCMPTTCVPHIVCSSKYLTNLKSIKQSIMLNLLLHKPFINKNINLQHNISFVNNPR